MIFTYRNRERFFNKNKQRIREERKKWTKARKKCVKEMDESYDEKKIFLK